MKKDTIVIFVILLIIIIIGCVILIKNNNWKNENIVNQNGSTEVINKTDNKIENAENILNNISNEIDNNKSQDKAEKSNTKYTFSNEFGDGTKTISIEAAQLETASGYPGSSANVYYIKDGDLYHLELINLTIQKIATNVENLTKEEENIKVKVKSDYEVLVEDMYIEYLK